MGPASTGSTADRRPLPAQRGSDAARRRRRDIPDRFLRWRGCVLHQGRRPSISLPGQRAHDHRPDALGRGRRSARRLRRRQLRLLPGRRGDPGMAQRLYRDVASGPTAADQRAPTRRPRGPPGSAPMGPVCFSSPRPRSPNSTTRTSTTGNPISRSSSTQTPAPCLRLLQPHQRQAGRAVVDPRRRFPTAPIRARPTPTSRDRSRRTANGCYLRLL